MAITHGKRPSKARAEPISAASSPQDLDCLRQRQTDDEAQVKAGAGPEVVRLSFGTEEPKDLIADLDQAMVA